jgi:hypothetical protein
MTRDGRPDGREELRELAALRALELLDPGDAAAFDAACESSDELREEARALREAAGRLAEALPAAAPPAGLGARLLAGVRGAEGAAPGLHDQRARDGIWEPTGHAGVSVRRLHADPASGLATLLVRMSAGAGYPGHRHVHAEQCLVIEGDLRCGGVTYLQGDFLWAEPGSDHPPLHSAGGALLLVVGGATEEWAPAR